MPVSENPMRLHHREFRHALAHRLHHGVAGQEQEHEQHRADHGAGQDVDVAQRLQPGLQGDFFGQGSGGSGGIGEEIVDRLADRGGVVGIIDPLGDEY